MGPKSSDCCPYKKKGAWRHIDTGKKAVGHGGREIKVVQLQTRNTKDSGSHENLGEKHGTDSPSGPKRNSPCQHLDF